MSTRDVGMGEAPDGPARFDVRQRHRLPCLNISEFRIRQAEIEGAMQLAMAPALAHFQRAWVLWKARRYRPWATDGANT